LDPGPGAMVRGRFIVFEGLDGSGTTTQAALLCAFLRRHGHKAVQTSEPTLGPVGILIRHTLSGRAHLSSDETIVRRHLAFLFAADRHDHLFNDVDGIVTLLDRGIDVLSTRYYLSSLAYNALTDNDLDFVYRLNDSFPLPDVTFMLGCSVDECVRRIAADLRSHDRHENEETLRMVEDGYRRALQIYQGRTIFIDAERDPEIIQIDIVAELERLVVAA
jgi:dTMP kinase